MKIKGHIDGIFNKQIVGWVYNIENYTSELIVKAQGSNGRNLHSIANILREDLVEANIGSGRYGYAFDISEWNSCDIDIFLLNEGSSQKLNEAPLNYVQTDTEQRTEQVDCLEHLTGNIDIVNSHEIIGWACNKKNLSEAVVLTARNKNGKSIDIVADIYRSDVRDVINGSGNYGFMINLKYFEYCGPIEIVFAGSEKVIGPSFTELDPIDNLLGDDIPSKIRALLQSAINKNISEFEGIAHD